MAASQQPLIADVHRSDFPPNFVFGVVTSAYQIEGATLTDGRSMSTWDFFSHVPGNILDGSTGDVACDHYHQFKSDIQLMVDLGVNVYRMSISWPRICPDSTGVINQAGVAFYDRIFNELVHQGIEPYVTLYHWDMPLYLENDPQVKGWRTKEIITHFVYFAETCFKLFGDRVKNWVTLNEVQLFAVKGYGYGTDAPGRCSALSGTKKNVYTGDSSTEPYLVAHMALLSHAAAVKIYREKFQFEQKGRIGIAVNSKWYEPYSKEEEDYQAAQRSLEFCLAWILDPIILGDYPESMRRSAGTRLPYFTEEESKELKGSVDFVGLNYYTSNFARKTEKEVNPDMMWYSTDRQTAFEYIGQNGELIGEAMGPPSLGWIYNCPWGLPKLLGWMETRYGKKKFQGYPIIITENGCMDSELNPCLKKALNDKRRVSYLSGMLEHLRDAINNEGYNVQGYFLWSLLDNFEWTKGVICRFGLHYVDYTRDQRRHPKLSAKWYRQFLSKEDSSSSSKQTCESGFRKGALTRK